MINQLRNCARFIQKPLKLHLSGSCRTVDTQSGFRPVVNCPGLFPKASRCKSTATSARQVKTISEQPTISEGLDLGLKNISLYCNEDRWHEIKEPIRIDATFIDTHYNAPISQQNTTPTILGIHDTPGCHKDLLPVLETFAESGYRVVILNMPGYGYTKVAARKERQFFTHTTEEKTHFLIKFLSEIDLLRIDLAVGHGTGTGPLTMLLASSDLIKSALFLCPTPGLDLPESFGTMKKINKMLNLQERPLFKLPVRLALQRLCEKNNISVSMANVEPVLREISGYGYEYLGGIARSTSYKKTKLTYIIASKDERYEPESSYVYAELFGIQRNRFTASNEETPENLENRASKSRSHLKVGIELMTSDHNPQLNEYYKNVIISESARLLKEVKR